MAEKEYIEREALPPEKERGFFLDDDFNAGWNACLNKVNSIPAADVVEVVRCKDCIHASMTSDGTCKYCAVWSQDEAVYLDGDYYCADGEKEKRWLNTSNAMTS